jgi:hypothetical protein
MRPLRPAGRIVREPERGCRHAGRHDRPNEPTDAEVRRVAGRLAGRDLIPLRKRDIIPRRKGLMAYLG